MTTNRYSELALAGPTPLDMVRALPAIRRSPLPFLADCVKRFGDAVAFPVPGVPAMLINHPDDVTRVLNDNAGAYSKATIQYGALSLVTGAGLLTSDNPPWKQRRAVIQPAFRPSGFARFGEVTVDAATGMRQRWLASPGRTLDAEAAVMTTMLEVVGRSLFRDDLADVGQEVVDAVDEALRVVIMRAQSPLPSALMPRSRARLDRAKRVLDDACATVIGRRRALSSNDFAESSSADPHSADPHSASSAAGAINAQSDDVLGLLLAAHDAGLIDAQAVRDEMVTMVIAGHETVASALTWSLHLLSTHPREQELLATELETVLGEAGGVRRPVWSDLPALRRTRAVLDEALRLYPPAWVITRRSEREDTIAGITVPPGTLVIISPWLVHRRADSYPDPERFDPQRFMASDGARGLSRPTGRYLPFGVGPRLCIGRDAALAEGTLVLATLLHGLRVQPLLRDVRSEALVTLRAHGGLPLGLNPAGKSGIR